MKKLCLGIAVVLVFGMIASVAVAQVGKGLNGPHYNLNIIGVKREKDIGNSNGHTLFVLLGDENNPKLTKIVMEQGDDFVVLDRDGTDGDALFQLGPGEYDVYAVALGKPGGKVDIEAIAEILDDSGTQMISLGTAKLERKKGRPAREDISRLFRLTITVMIDGVEYKYKNEWIFNILGLIEYYWNYNNKGCKLLQVRFYPKEADAAPAKGGPTTAWAAIKSGN